MSGLRRTYTHVSCNTNCRVVFALVTASGSLIVYNMNIPASSLVKIAAHGDDASTLDWHPTRPYVLATGAADRCVKGNKDYRNCLMGDMI